MENLDLTSFFNIVWDAIKDWWWAVLPIILLRPFLFFWLWWRRDLFRKAQQYILLEIRMPKEVLKPLKAMEQVFSSLWGNLYDSPDLWEKWIDGKFILNYSIEMVSIGGESHFFIKITSANRNAVESTIYSQYPDAEILVVDDYVKYVPQNIPNADWDLWGCDYKLAKDDVYPIKTYSKFFEETEVAKEEKRIDPMSTLLEGLSRLQPGEQLWIQIMASPVSVAEDDYVARGRVVADKLARRPEAPKQQSVLLEAANVLVTGKPAGAMEKKEEGMIIPPEMKLTPGEKEILSGVENKISKSVFNCNIRFIYLGKKDVFFKPQIRIPFGFFQQFATSNMNGLKPWGQPLITKVPKSFFLPLNLLRPRRLYLRQRRMFRRYVERQTPFHPKAGGTFILNIEELATIFHFPGRAVAAAPFMQRVESKKGEAPPGLPTEFMD